MKKKSLIRLWVIAFRVLYIYSIFDLHKIVTTIVSSDHGYSVAVRLSMSFALSRVNGRYYTAIFKSQAKRESKKKQQHHVNNVRSKQTTLTERIERKKKGRQQRKIV